jgi:AcrR family transcriptional regulator
MSNKSKLDPRVRRTRKWLQEALLSLMLTKPFSKISIAEITDQANVSRPTFYLHYKTKEELLIAYLDGIYESFMDDMEQYIDFIAQGKLAIKLYEQVAENATFLRSLINSEVSNLVMEKMQNYCYDVIKKLFDKEPLKSNKNLSDSVKDFTVSSMAGSTYAMSMQWLKTGMPLSPKEMGELTMRLLKPGMEDVLTNG